MTPEPFVTFSLTHLITVAIVFTVIVSAVWWGRRSSLASARRAGHGLAVFLILYYFAEGVLRVELSGVDPILIVPGELCSALFFIGAVALWTDHRVAHEVLFFWTFAGTMHALITPTPVEGYPSFEYVRFFTNHGLLVLTAAYAVIALDKRMTWWSLLRAAVALQLFEGLVALVDWGLDQNFMYLRYPPPSPTLMDALGPWPLYLLSLEVIALVSFALWLGILKLTRRVIPVRAESLVLAPLEPQRDRLREASMTASRASSSSSVR